MKKQLLCLFILLCICSLPALMSKNYYIATDGSDTNTGAITSPYATLNKAQSQVVAGDTVYIRGGVYRIATSQVMEYSGIFARVFKLDKSGTASKRICYFGYPGERPVFDLSDVKPADYRVYVFFVSGSYLHFKNFEVVGTQVTILDHTQSECFHHEGGNNCVYENLSMHDGKAIGFYLTKGSNNLVLNCDAYNNWDDVSENKKGGNTDGFGGHPNSASYTGNVFRGCRAWYNSDDGFDLISAHAAYTIENCWAWRNGYSTTNASLGDGTGIKAGGYGMSASPKVPTVIPRHVVRFCLAYYNKNRGIYANHHLGGVDFVNNTSYQNPVNYEMVNRKNATDATPVDVAGYGHTLKNNVSYLPRTANNHVANINTAESEVMNNSFTLSLSLGNPDFESIDAAQLSAPRKADGSLPDIDFLKPKAGSKLIDKGVDLGFPFAGSAPDLGYAEYQIPAAIESAILDKDSDKEILSREYYDITGKKATGKSSGLLICRTIYTDNSLSVSKIWNK
ncbi:right-handed parallel beta-helix repeat-containing protein [Viscerimonas tarda]